MGIEIGREFLCKEVVKDLIDRILIKNCFGIVFLNYDTVRYVVRCRGAENICECYVRVIKVRNYEVFFY